MGKNNQIAVTIWFTGLSVSGKSTLSQSLHDELIKQGIDNVVLLDGETIRDQLKNYNYDTKDRNAIGIQKSKIALKYISKGKHVIITGIAHHKKTRDEIRNMFPYYYEVYLKCNVAECLKRDYKGNYEKAFNGVYDNFVGVTEQYEESNPELIVETDKYSIAQCVTRISKSVIEYINMLSIKQGSGKMVVN